MNRWYFIIAVFLLVSVSSFQAFAAEITIIGEINDTNQIVAEGEVYEVDDTPEGDELVSKYISKRVKVTGKLRLEGDMRIFTVKSYSEVEE